MRSLALLTVLAPLAACRLAPKNLEDGASCTANDQCLSDRCLGGSCGNCASAFDCPAGQVCISAICQPAAVDAGCGANGCPAGLACAPDGNCGEPNPTGCRSTAECQQGIGGLCIDGGCVPCTASSQCTPQICSVGNCVTPPPPCNDQCFPGEVCDLDSGTCVIDCCGGDCLAPQTCEPSACKCFCGNLDAGCPSGAYLDSSSCSCETPAPGYTCGAFYGSSYDAGSGPGPTIPDGGLACYACAGCPTGSECVCLTGDRCGQTLDPGCFLTGTVGSCQIFPGDCATNAQCEGLTGTPICSSAGRCVECLQDSDCPQDGGPLGCIANQCLGCCNSDRDCSLDNGGTICNQLQPPASKYAGYCEEQCQSDAQCAGLDAGTPYCSYDNECIQCTEPSQCPASAPGCNEVTGQCGSCYPAGFDCPACGWCAYDGSSQTYQCVPDGGCDGDGG